MPNKSNTVVRFQDISTLDISTLAFSMPVFYHELFNHELCTLNHERKESEVEKSRYEM